jgi:uncharacterized membrane protein YfcA
MIDILIAIVSLSVLGSFLGLIAWHVPQAPLVAIFTLIFLMAAYDFWRQLRQNSDKQDS